MKALLALSAAALLAAGCATTENVQVAEKKECKIALAHTSTVANPYKAKPQDSLRQREAEMNLATSQYRFAQLQRNGVFNNLNEEALRDCY